MKKLFLFAFIITFGFLPFTGPVRAAAENIITSQINDFTKSIKTKQAKNLLQNFGFESTSAFRRAFNLKGTSSSLTSEDEKVFSAFTERFKDAIKALPQDLSVVGFRIGYGNNLFSVFDKKTSKFSSPIILPPSGNVATPSILTMVSDTGSSSTDHITKNTTLTFSGTASPGSIVTLFDDRCVSFPPPPPPPSGDQFSLNKTNFLSKILDIFSVKKALAIPPENNCSNGLDDNNDGPIDCADNSCKNDPACYVAPTAPDLTFGVSGGIQEGSNITIPLSCSQEIFWYVSNNSANDVSCTASSLPSTSEWTGPITPNYYYADSKPLSSFNQTMNYTLACTNSAGTTTKTAIVNTLPPYGIGTTTANSAGNWSLTVALSPATYSIKARATDVFGNKSAASAPLWVTIDKTAPAFENVLPTPGSAISIGSYSGVNYTLSETLLSGTITITRTGGPAGTNDPASPHVCTLSNSAKTAGVHNALNLTTNGCTVAQSLVNNAFYTFSFSGTDTAGNIATTVTRTNVKYNDKPTTIVTECTSAQCFYLIPQGATKIGVELWAGAGGGGGGGFSDTWDYGGGGGGGGALGGYDFKEFFPGTGPNTFQPGALLTSTVGVGGAGGGAGTGSASAGDGLGGSGSFVSGSNISISVSGGAGGGKGDNASHDFLIVGQVNQEPGAGGGGWGTGGEGGSDVGGGGGGGWGISPNQGEDGSSNGTGGIGSSYSTAYAWGPGMAECNQENIATGGAKGGNGGAGGGNANNGSAALFRFLDRGDHFFGVAGIRKGKNQTPRPYKLRF